ncbi:methylated-DNA--[protein]-cysteine S-methyltransferase [Actinocorallia aurantiaca]|uniref:Methylated-DNA--protein-cysteine methyltransferase n=1 Tax=Actinocorallia aurantiaca TaxID=46204 RepID=A0ABP6H6F7_9ACTN
MESFGWTILQSPIGPLMLAETEQGLVNVRFHAHDAEYHAHRAGSRLGLRPMRGGLCEATAQISAYFAADLTEFTLPLDWRLTSGFNERVLRLLYARVGYGQTAGYGELARWTGDPGASRAVGTAMGSNPLPVVVPCHRVVTATGDIGGFGGGLDAKRALLALEGVLPAPLF